MFIKNKIKFIILSIIFTIALSTMGFSFWLFSNETGAILWVHPDMVTYQTGGWSWIDDDNDGVGYYYYFDEDGRLLIDTITPDYEIVNWYGQKVDKYGEPIAVSFTEASTDGNLEFPQLEQMIKSGNIQGEKSEGSIGKVVDHSGPSQYIQVNADDNKGVSKQIIGKNVVFNQKESMFDPELDRSMKNYIVGGSNYSKKVNGTIFTKVKWKDCMSLKGDGAYIDFENPKNNFNRVKGKIATHYFTYSDRTTICTLSVYDESEDDLIFSTGEFNYNSGVNFDFLFSRRYKKLRFVLNVTGEYTTRTCYIRDLNYMFDKTFYQEELEEWGEDEYYAQLESIASNQQNDDTSDEDDVDPADTDTSSDDEDDDNEKEATEDDLKTGPQFDKNLNATKSEAYNPDGSKITNTIKAKSSSD